MPHKADDICSLQNLDIPDFFLEDPGVLDNCFIIGNLWMPQNRMRKFLITDDLTSSIDFLEIFIFQAINDAADISFT